MNQVASNTIAAVDPDAQAKAELAAEIARIEAELERKRLEDEINRMQAQIAAAQQKQNGEPPKKRVVKRMVRKTRPRPKKRESLKPADSSAEAKANCDVAEVQRKKLEDEIRQMEEAIVAERRKKAAQVEAARAAAEAKPPPPPPRTAAPAALSPEEEAVAARFRKMAKMGIPEGAVRNKMTQEGVDPKIVAVVLGAEAPPTPAKPPLSAADLQRQQLEAEIAAMEAAIAAQQASNNKQSTTSPATPAPAATPMAPAGFLSAITQAATDRETRLEETGGELVMQDIEPEVAERAQSTPQLSFSMAEMVTKKALEREKRLEEGGEKKMTVIKEKSEYKADFNDICIEAAELGRLTRLNEHVVEAVAREKTPEEEWRSNGLLAIQWRSNHMSVIHEAAAAGAACKLPEKIVSNCPEEEQDWELEGDENPMSPRMRQLLELNQEVGAGQHKVDKLVMGRKEQRSHADSMIVRPMYCYSNIDEIELPRTAPPKIDVEAARRRLAKKMQEAEREHRPLADIGNEVATRAWERRTRLDRPNMLPKIKEKCPCPYCIDASPYQTYAYKIREKHAKEGGYELKNEPVDPQRLERERRRAERLRQTEQEPVVEETFVGMNAARSRFGQSVSQSAQAAAQEAQQQEVVLSNLPADLVSQGTGDQSVVDDASSIYSGAVSMDGSMVSTESRPRTGRVVRKVRKVRKKRPVNRDSRSTATSATAVSQSSLAVSQSIQEEEEEQWATPAAAFQDDGSVAAAEPERGPKVVRKRRPRAPSQKQSSQRSQAKPAAVETAPPVASTPEEPVKAQSPETPAKKKGLFGGLFGRKKGGEKASQPSGRTKGRVSRKKR